ncbi:MAG: response regulator [Betaproteobacteria bacterium]|nr:response regulator [Betaproteobacteria bacterium]
MPRIVVIDDDVNMRDLLRIHLSRVGLAVEAFEDASLGIHSILENRPDLVVLDLLLPDLGGLEVLKALKSDLATKDLPVVVLTSRTDEATFTEAKRLGADAFLIKPISRDELTGTVLGQLAKRAAKDIASSAG